MIFIVSNKWQNIRIKFTNSNLNFVINFKIYSEQLLLKVTIFGFNIMYFWRPKAIITYHSTTFRSYF